LRKKFFPIVIVLILFLTSCSSIRASDPIEVNPEFHNDYISLRTDAFPNSFESGMPIIFSLIYDFDYEFHFANNFGIRIFEKTKDGWNEIGEVPTIREPQGDVVLSPEKDVPFPYLISVQPKLPDKYLNYNLRIFIFGKMKKGDEMIDVSASFDVKLRPNFNN